MKKLSILIAAASLLAGAAQTPADAHGGYGYHGGYHGGGTSTLAAVAIGVGAAGLGYAVGSHQSQTAAPSYAYQQPSYGYQPQSQIYGYQQSQGYGYQDQGYTPSIPVAQPGLPSVVRRPAPGGVRCLVWNGQTYVPYRNC